MCDNPTVLLDFTLTAAGIALLYYGGEHLVGGASTLARSLGVSNLVIGLTVIAFGTSAPELAASITAAVFRDAPEIALANVIGSNIANLGLILGVAGLIYPLAATAAFLRREIPFMVLVSVVLIGAVAARALVRPVGGLFLALLAFYLWFLFRVGGEVPVVEDEEEKAALVSPLWSGLRVALGVGLLAIGARILIDGAIGVASDLGVSQRIIGLTLVAVGTSLPELATVVVAALRAEGDLILGNLIGSNIFNILCIMGFTLLVHPLDIPFAGVAVDLWVMLGFSVAIVPLLGFRMRIGPKRAGLLLASYLVYVVALFF